MDPQQNSHLPPSPVPPPQPQEGTWSMAAMAQHPSVPHQMAVPPIALMSAGDKDLIEREWADAVKKVVHDNNDDPYAMAKALTELKVRYMKQRYNEDLKLPE